MFILPALVTVEPHGDRVNLREYLDGGRRPASAILISFYALWCLPCQAELPFLRMLHEEYSGHGLQVFLISTDPEEKDRQLRKTLLEKGPLPFPVLRDPHALVYKRHRLTTLPALYVVSSQGIVTRYVDGFSEEAKARVRAALDELLSNGGD